MTTLPHRLTGYVLGFAIVLGAAWIIGAATVWRALEPE